MKEQILNVVQKLHQISRKIWFSNNYRHRKKKLREAGIKVKRLSSVQKQQIRKLWGKNADCKTHELIYSITGNFNPYYCSQMLFGSKLEFCMNDDTYKTAWSDKNFFNLHFPEVRFPSTLVRNIYGEFYDCNYNLISLEKAVSIISAYEKVVIKPSLDSGMGKGVKLVTVDDKIHDIIKSYKKDFIIQEVLEQHKDIKAFNPSSVNVIRLNSLFLNGKVSYLSASLRIGAEGAFNDNSITKDGKGMVVVGIKDDGYLKDFGFYSCGEKVEISRTGIKFSECKIPNFEKAKELALKMHSKMPFAKYVGFDVAFDLNGDPIIMEYNINAPGVFYYQLVNGPLFAHKTEEVIKTFLSKEH